MINTKTKIFLSGHKGMVGSSILRELRNLEFENIIYRTHEELDLCSYSEVLNFLKREMPEVIIHTAGKVGGIQANMKDPISFFLNNLDMGRNLVGAAFELGIKNFINLGSSCMYPRNCEELLTEDMVLKGELEPTNEGYAIAKCAVAKLCQYIDLKSDYNYKTFIPCNLYGLNDKFDLANAHMIPAIISKLQNAKDSKIDTVEIWGSGKARREFMFVDDLARTISAALYKLSQLPSYLNVGLGYDYTVDEYYEIISRIVGYKGSFTHDLMKPEGMKRKCVDITTLKNEGLSFITPLELGIQATYKYYMDNIHYERKLKNG